MDSRKSQLKKEIKRLEKTIEHQRNILQHKKIPKQYTPKCPEIAIPNNGTLHNQFYNEFGKFFFNNLNRIIDNNQIALGIKEQKLRSFNRTETPKDTMMEHHSAAEQQNITP